MATKPKPSLEVKVLSAQNVLAADDGGTSDPYVKIKVGPKGKEVSTQKQKATLSPVWNETHQLPVVDPKTEEVLFSLFDSDMMRDDPLGSVSFPLKDLVQGVDTPLTLDIKAPLVIPSLKKGAPPPTNFGKLNVVLKAINFGSVPTVPQQATKSESLEPAQTTGAPPPAKGAATPVQSTGVPPPVQGGTAPVQQTPAKATTAPAAPVVREIPNTKEEMAAKAIQDTYKNSQAKKEAAGNLLVTVVEAKDLIPADDNGLSDPYVVMTVGKANAKTKPADKTLNPKWGSVHKLAIAQPSTDVLEITIFDKDSIFSRDENLGSVTVPLQNLQKGVAVDGWYPVQAPKVIPPGKPGAPPPKEFGSIHIGLKPLDFGVAGASQPAVKDTAPAVKLPEAKGQLPVKEVTPPKDSAPAKAVVEPVSAPVSTLPKGTKGRLGGKVIEAKGLIPADSNGLSDPYVKLSIGKSTAKTDSVSKTLSPVFNATFELEVTDPNTDQLKVEVFDKDSLFSQDEPLGSVSIPLNTLQKGVEVPKWYTLNAPPVLPKKAKTEKPPTTFGQINLAIVAHNFGLPPSAQQTKVEEKKPEVKPVEQKPVEQKPVEQKPVEQKPVEQKPVEQKPAVEQKPVEQKPAEQKPAEQKPAEQKPVEQKPVEQKPIEQKPVEQKPAAPTKQTELPRQETKPAVETRPAEVRPVSKQSMEPKSPGGSGAFFNLVNTVATKQGMAPPTTPEERKKIDELVATVDLLDEKAPPVVKETTEAAQTVPLWSYLVVAAVFALSIYSADLVHEFTGM